MATPPRRSASTAKGWPPPRRWARGLALANLGVVARERGDFDEARSLHTEAGANFDGLGYRVGQAVTA